MDRPVRRPHVVAVAMMPGRRGPFTRLAAWTPRLEPKPLDVWSSPQESDHALAQVLSEFARTMATDFPIQGILDHLVQRTVEILPITAAGVTLISAGSDPRFIAASNEDALAFEQLQTELGEGPCLVAYHSGNAFSVPDLNLEDQFPAFTPRALEAGLAAVFTFPLHHEQTRLGALDLYRDTTGPLPPSALIAAQTLADVAAAYLLNAQAREDLEHYAKSSREASLHDPLTGLPNRTLMSERLEHAILRARRSQKTTALFFVDLNRFKEVNDTYGHGVGDDLLILVAQRLAGVIRPSDTIARMSGDEFVILCEELDDPSHADAVPQRIHNALEAPFIVGGHELSMTASIGSAIDAYGNDLPAELLRDADRAMYMTKRIGPGGYAALGSGGTEEEQAGLGEALLGAADRGELSLDYQPIVDTRNGRLTGAEALLRWNHPSVGTVPPLQLIPLAERSGQIVELGHWVLQQAWAERQRWKDSPSRRLGVSVNVSVQQLLAGGFADMVATVLLAGSGDPQWLTLEVTEGVFVADNARAAVVLKTLKDMGVQLALDDFGTGYSSLGHLLSYPVDIVKVDRTFVAKLGHDEASDATVTALIELGHNLGMTVVSEGVENAGQHEVLTRLASESCQGYYFARPMSSDNLEALIRTHTNGDSPRLPAAAQGSFV
jgi:diguanylate cyclase (GGDEF)-like protein